MVPFLFSYSVPYCSPVYTMSAPHSPKIINSPTYNNCAVAATHIWNSSELFVCFICMFIYTSVCIACCWLLLLLLLLCVVVFNSIRVQSIKIICKCQKILTVCGDVLQITFVIACFNVYLLIYNFPCLSLSMCARDSVFSRVWVFEFSDLYLVVVLLILQSKILKFLDKFWEILLGFS